MADAPEVINLGAKEIDPNAADEYRKKIAAAKAGTPLSSLKGSDPLGGVPRPPMPILQKSAKGEVVSAPQAVTPRPPGSPVLRPETEQQLKDAIAAGKAQDQAAAEQQTLDEKKLAEDARLTKLFESLDLGDQRSQFDRILDNKKRKDEIEGRCAPMLFEDLLMKDEVSQRVPIQPGKFEPLFRSVTPLETLYLKQRMARETTTTDVYLGEKYNLLLLTCSLVDLNGHPLPDHRKHKSDGTFEIDDKLFDEKLAALVRKSAYIIADLSVNYMWFDIRVRKLLNPEDVKNG